MTTQLVNLKKVPFSKLLLAFFAAFSFLKVNAQDVHFEWVKSAGGADDEQGLSIAVDKSGNVFTTGYFRGTSDFNLGGSTAQYLTAQNESDVFVTKHNADGDLVWAKRYGAARNDQGNSVTTDDMGNVYLAGTFVEEMDFGTTVLKSNGEQDIFIAKLDTDGNCLWATNIGNDGDQVATSIAVDRAGTQVYVVGMLMKGDVDMNPKGSPAIMEGECMFILKLKGTGDYVWAKRVAWENGFVDLSESLDAIHLSTEGNLHIVGQFMGTVDFDPEKTGKTLTSQIAGGNNFEDVFVLKLNKDGKFVWAKALNGTGRNYCTGVSTDDKENVYFTGSFDGIADFDPGPSIFQLTTSGIYQFDTYISKLDSDGNFVWAKQIGGKGTLSRGHALTTDNKGHTFVAGGFKNKIDFNPSTAPQDTFFLKTEGASSSDAFLLKLDENGYFQWAKSLKGTSNSVPGSRNGLGIAIDEKGSVYTTGGFQGTTDFDPDPTNSVELIWKGHNADIFIHKMSCASSDTTISVFSCKPYTFGGETYRESGIYKTNFYNNSNCDSTVTLKLTIKTLSKPQITVDSFKLSTIETYDRYQWLLDGAPISGATQRSYTVSVNGNYRVAVENKEGCKDTSEVYEVTNHSETRILESALTGSISIFPNPATDFISINSPVKIIVELFSIEGRLLERRIDPRKLSVAAYASGFYLLKIHDEQYRLIKTEKLVKSN